MFKEAVFMLLAVNAVFLCSLSMDLNEEELINIFNGSEAVVSGSLVNQHTISDSFIELERTLWIKGEGDKTLFIESNSFYDIDCQQTVFESGIRVIVFLCNKGLSWKLNSNPSFLGFMLVNDLNMKRIDGIIKHNLILGGDNKFNCSRGSNRIVLEEKDLNAFTIIKEENPVKTKETKGIMSSTKEIVNEHVITKEEEPVTNELAITKEAEPVTNELVITKEEEHVDNKIDTNYEDDKVKSILHRYKNIIDNKKESNFNIKLKEQVSNEEENKVVVLLKNPTESLSDIEPIKESNLIVSRRNNNTINKPELKREQMGNLHIPETKERERIVEKNINTMIKKDIQLGKLWPVNLFNTTEKHIIKNGGEEENRKELNNNLNDIPLSIDDFDIDFPIFFEPILRFEDIDLTREKYEEENSDEFKPIQPIAAN